MNQQSAISNPLGKRIIAPFARGAAVAAMVLLAAGPVQAGTLWWDGGTADIGANGDGLSAGGGGTWIATLMTWDQGAAMPHVAWNNATNDTAVFGGSGGTVALETDITLGGLQFEGASSTTIAGGTLNFGPGGTITSLNSSAAEEVITSAITGSPSVGVSAQAAPPPYDYVGGLRFAPSSGSVALGTVTLALNAGIGGLWDKTILWLSGSTTGNTLGDVRPTPANGGYYSQMICDSGEWTVTGTAQPWTANIRGGTVKVTGTLNPYAGAYVYSGSLHYNSPGGVNGALVFAGGNLDQTSGAAITTSTYNPSQQWNADWTFIGSNDANSDLNLGTGAVALGGNRTVTVQNPSAALTVGGVIGSGIDIFGLTKSGDGTLKLTGVNTYKGTTTVAAGTLSLTQPCLCDDAIVSVTTGATLNLDYEGTDTVFAIFIDGTPAAAGEWGGPGTTAANKTNLLSGTGILISTGGLAPEGTWYWDGPNSGGTGDGTSDGGSGVWSTSSANWDQGVVSRKVWNNATSGSTAIFGGAAGTVTLGEAITVSNITFSAGNGYVISDSTLNFSADGSISNLNVQYGVVQTITSAITGSPNVGIIASTLGWDIDGGMSFRPPVGATQALGTVTLAAGYPSLGGSDKTTLWLRGTSTGNTISNVVQSTPYSLIRKNDSGEWTVTGVAQCGRFYMDGGDLIVTGTLRTTEYTGVSLNSGTLHYDSPGAIQNTAGRPLFFAGGNLDQSSGTPITTSMYNPTMQWDANFTFLGSNGANSDLDLGTGSVLLTGTRTVTINNDATLTVGGAISGGASGYGLTKDGTGTLVLAGANTYTGGTTVLAGTLAVSGNSIADTGKLVINGGKVDVAAAANEVVNSLYFGTDQQLDGTYGSTGSSATNKDDSRFSGSGIVTVAPVAPTGILLTTVNSGSGTLTFDATPPADQWSTLDITTGGSSTLFDAATMDAAAQALDASNISTGLVTGTNTTSRLAQHYNQALYTRPTGVPAVVLMATLRNMTGGAVNDLTISYDYGMSAGDGEQVTGHRVYYSMTGLANSWTPIPALCSAAPGTLTTNVDLSATPLAAAAVMYVLWLDDNATGTEEINTIDNASFTISTPGGYTSWAKDYAGKGQPNEDYNNDGVANGVAYFMGMNGLATNPGVENGKVTWPHVNAVTSYEVQVSDNLNDWSSAAAGDVDTTSSPGNVIFTLPTGPGITKKFCRLMVTP
ncbi:MAG: autotransporter-associated beta strand repeat-containing protein [Verrucomicrobia bacterium]|nr:autotransporter-associated beta strand repeat-containing protein [Verrucomicrobiota bacterium]